MNIFSKFYCRTYQMIFKVFLPFLPYREPVVLNNESDIFETLKKENLSKIMLVTDENIRALGLTASIESKLKNFVELTVYDKVQINPTTNNVEDAVKEYEINGCEGIIAFGGGSVIDCAKAIGACVVSPHKSILDMKGLLKINKKTPVMIAVPTTAGTGSEATLAAVITDSETKIKFTINDFDLIPDYALLDPKLTVGLPPEFTATTGMDALTHAVEAFIGKTTTKTTRKYALEAIKLIFENLEKAYTNGEDLEARENMLKASFMAGLAFSKSYVGYVHAIAHSLGGKYNIPHALANSILLPCLLRFYGKSVYKKLWKIGKYAGLFDKQESYENGARKVIEKIERMNKAMKIQVSFDCIEDKDIPSMAKTAAEEANPLYPVPKLFSAKELEKVYHIVKGDRNK